MKNYIVFICLILYTFTTTAQSKIEKDVSALFNAELKKQLVYNGVLNVYSNSKSIHIQLAEGTFKNGEAVTNNHPFYTASIGKTFTATAIALLKEEGKLAFNDAIGQYLPEAITNGLHILNGVDSSAKITIAQLLQHTSGLPDYFEDSTIDESPNIISQLFMDTDKTWTPLDCIQFTKEKMKPLFLPGEGYHYSDTEYVLLGLIVENFSGLKLHDFFKQHIFQPLNMNHMYLNLKSKPIDSTPQMAEVFVGDQDLSGFNSLSADWAGGGIVATAADLITFQQALFNTTLLTAETLDMMQQWTPETQGMYYGFGLRKIVFNELHPSLPNIEVIGHSGSTGSFLYYCPALDTYISGTLNQAEEVRATILLIANILNLM